MPQFIKTINNKIKHHKKQLLILSIIVVILSTLYSVVLPGIINLDKHRSEVLRLSRAKERVNGILHLGKMGLELPITGGIVITFKTVKLDNYNGSPIFSANNVKCKIAIIPLIFKDLVIKNVEAKDFILYTIRDKADHLTIEDAFRPPFPDDIFIIRFWNTHANVTDYQIHLKDKFITPNKQLYINGKNLLLLGLTENKNIKFKVNGLLNKSNAFDIETYCKFPLTDDIKENTAYTKGDIYNFDLESIKEYLPYTNIKGVIDSKFDINIRNKTIHILNKTTIEKALKIPELKLTVNSGSAGLKAIISPEKIQIKRLLSNLNNSPIELKGEINKWQTKNPEPNLHIKTSVFNINDLYTLIPLLPETEYLIDRLNASKLSGKTLLDIKIKGSIEKINAYGKLILQDYSVKLSNKDIINDISAQLNFDGSKIIFKDLLIPLAKGDLVQINGIIDHNKLLFDNLNISTNEINLTKLKSIILSAASFMNYDIPLLSNIYINGDIKTHLILNNKIDKPEINGNLTISANNIEPKNIYQPIKKVNGLISFEKDKINIKNLDVNITDTSKAKITGFYNFNSNIIEGINITSKNINLNQIQKLVISLTSLLQIDNEPLKLYTLTGNSNVNLVIKGELDDIKPYGSINISNTKIKDDNHNTSIDNINGQISLDNDIKLNNIKASLLENVLIISGLFQLNGDGKIKVDIPNLKINALKTLAENYKLIPPDQKDFIDEAKIDGSITGELNILKKGDTITPEANVKINNTIISHRMLFDDVAFTRGNIKLTPKELSINDLSMVMSGSTFNVLGSANNIDKTTPNYNIKATSNDFNFALLKNIGEHETTPQGIKNILANVKNMSGKTNISLNASDKDFQINVKLYNLSIETEELDNPIKNIDGEIIVGTKLISLNNVHVDYEGSNILIDGSLSNLNTEMPFIDAKIKGELSPLSFKEYYIKELKDKVVFTKPIIFNGYAKGNIYDWDIVFNSEIPLDSTVEIKGLFKKPDNIPVKLVIDGKGSKHQIDVDQITFQVGESSFNANGLIKYPEDKELTIDDMHLKIPNINLDQINTFLEKGLLTDNLTGNINTDIVVSGKAIDPDVTGYINFDKVSLPMIKTKELSFNVELEKQKASINNAYLNINGVIFELSTQIRNFKRIPLELTNLHIYSPSLRLTDLLDSISTKTQDVSLNYLPIVIQNGLLTIDDAIIDKLITSNLKGTINLCTNGTFQINDISLNTAGGTATGNLYINLLNNTMGAQLQVIGVKANAAASVLLDLPNEVFGDLNATIAFDSHGEAYEEIIANAEGEASLIINDGRFSKLGTLEYLLTATNIINGGIAGLNLNNILATIVPMKTGSFEQLTGDFTVKQGLLKTNNLISRGKNLSLEISGVYNVKNDDADLNINGTLSRNVSGLLGPLGNLNIETLTDFIPGLGFIPGISTKKRKIGLLDLIPGLGFIPGFGGPGKKGKKVRTFAVEIQGKLYEKSSVKNFRWTK
ncbi:MAG: AsmA-like C-terminal region-containing protein [Vampirovibrionia bacterium]